MTRTSTALIDILYWPVTQISISFILVRLPARLFSKDSRITRTRGFERSLRLYRALLVPRWKKLLPDAAFLVGGSTKRVDPYCPADVARFLADLRRAEVAHWVQLVFAIPCWFWNPLWGSLFMTAYAICANAPCIAAQRYNRILMQGRAAGKKQDISPENGTD